MTVPPAWPAAGPRTRFAPAPTGYLHLGHVASAIHVWGIARSLAGTVLLRIEDHDRGRSRAEYEAAIVEDLAWLGFEADEGYQPVRPGASSPFRQSDGEAVYEAALARLALAGRVYACACSRADIAASVGHVAGEELPYPGTCRDRGLPWQGDIGLRVRLDAGEERFRDLRLGPMVQDPARQCGDLLVRDRLGQWTYQFAVVVDDMRQRIDLVIRGEDLLASTGRQLRLARMLGRVEAPHWYHHALLHRPDGAKLSKSSGDTGVRELRAAGWSAARVLGEAAWRAGLLPEAGPLSVAELPRLVPRLVPPAPVA